MRSRSSRITSPLLMGSPEVNPMSLPIRGAAPGVSARSTAGWTRPPQRHRRPEVTNRSPSTSASAGGPHKFSFILDARTDAPSTVLRTGRQLPPGGERRRAMGRSPLRRRHLLRRLKLLLPPQPPPPPTGRRSRRPSSTWARGFASVTAFPADGANCLELAPR